MRSKFGETYAHQTAALVPYLFWSLRHDLSPRSEWINNPGTRVPKTLSEASLQVIASTKVRGGDGPFRKTGFVDSDSTSVLGGCGWLLISLEPKGRTDKL